MTHMLNHQFYHLGDLKATVLSPAGQDEGGSKARRSMPLYICSVSCLDSRTEEMWIASPSLLSWILLVPSIN